MSNLPGVTFAFVAAIIKFSPWLLAFSSWLIFVAQALLPVPRFRLDHLIRAGWSRALALRIS
jgi:NADH:ubiquinone oxidoreductase subunit H